MKKPKKGALKMLFAFFGALIFLLAVYFIIKDEILQGTIFGCIGVLFLIIGFISKY